MSARFSSVTPGVWKLPMSIIASEVTNGGWFFFLWRLKLLKMIGVRFENSCTVSGKLNVSKIS